MSTSKEQHLRTATYLRIILVTSVCLIFAGCLLALFFVQIPEDNRPVVDNAIGCISTLLVAIVTYYFGNSVGSGKSSPTEENPPHPLIREESTDIDEFGCPYLVDQQHKQKEHNHVE